MKLILLGLLVCSIFGYAFPRDFIVDATIDRIVDGDWIVAICDETLTEYIMHIERHEDAVEGQHITIFYSIERTWYPLLYNMLLAMEHESLQDIRDSNNPELVLEALSPGINEAFWQFLLKQEFYNEQAQHLDRLIHTLYDHTDAGQTFPPLWVALHDLTYHNMPSIIDYFLYDGHYHAWIFNR